MPEPTTTPDAAADKQAAADEKQLQIAEQQAKVAEKLESAASSVASIAESMASRPTAPSQPAATPAAPAVLSEEQVMALVENKQITMAQAMTYLRKRASEEARVEARREAQQALVEVGSRADEAQTLADIAEYKKAVPGLGQRGSTEWNEVAQRFNKLVGKNYPATIKTELQALRELYGEEPAKREEPRERTKERATRGAEMPSSSSARTTPGPRRARASDEPDPDLSSDHRTYVDHMIRIGQYKGWNDPRAQKYVERAKSNTSRKARSA